MAKTQGLLKMKKEGEEPIDVNPQMVAAHQAVGWVLIDEETHAAQVVDAEAAAEKAAVDARAEAEKAAIDAKAAAEKAAIDAKAAKVKARPESVAAQKKAEADAETKAAEKKAAK